MQEVVELYFQDSAVKLERLSARLSESPPDYPEVDALVHQFKGSSASFGAQTITQHCVQVCCGLKHRLSYSPNLLHLDYAVDSFIAMINV